MSKGRKRRRWSDDEKRKICSQARMPGVSVAQVARRYALNANQIFNWLKNPKFGSDDNMVEDEQFLPVEIVAEPVPAVSTISDTGVIELELANGHRLRINGSYDPEAIGRLVRCLS